MKIHLSILWNNAHNAQCTHFALQFKHCNKNSFWNNAHNAHNNAHNAHFALQFKHCIYLVVFTYIAHSTMHTSPSTQCMFQQYTMLYLNVCFNKTQAIPKCAPKWSGRVNLQLYNVKSSFDIEGEFFTGPAPKSVDNGKIPTKQVKVKLSKRKMWSFNSGFHFFW